MSIINLQHQLCAFPIQTMGEDSVTQMMNQGASICQWKFDGQCWYYVSLGTMP